MANAALHNVKGVTIDIPTGVLTVVALLVGGGNTVILIEHHLDVIRRADGVIDLGPKGGAAGGEVLFDGPPAGLRNCPRSMTGRFV